MHSQFLGYNFVVNDVKTFAQVKKAQYGDFSSIGSGEDAVGDGQ